MKKTNAYQFFNKDYSVKEYSDMYKKLRLDIRYPANVKRDQIFVKLIKKHKPKKIIDAGCGAGMPLIDSKMKTWLRFSVFQQLISMSPRFQWASSFFSLRMISIIGNWIYLIVAKNRGKFSIFIK